ncbi:MAG: (2Fe-2S) ferredoxin domain-containing protein [Clostridiales bacterium]|jgi:NADH:ubiquinone oxidoreductase subunit E|nr:(2Fe-2S) ferredoxin domain-containing protein [Clostridiales bacterium]MDY4656000.1 (2Fe-2S) ferredoxin domain-containing protein [Eubacteriales bacterium]
MVIIQVCVGSSCHLKGAPQIVELLQKRIAEEGLEDEIVLTGSFCAGKCNRVGVTITVNDDIYTGITVENFNEFWNDKVKPAVMKNR